MPGFTEIATGHWSLKGLVVSTVLVLVGGALTIYHQVAGTTGAGGSAKIVFKCVNPKCGFVKEYSSEGYSKLIQKANEEWMKQQGIEVPKSPQGQPMDPMMMGMMGMGMMLPPWGQPGYPLVCPKCGERTFYRHIKCAKCGALFMEDYEKNPPDKCPKCGYSRIEERRKEARAKKQAERERKRSRRKRRSRR